MIETCNPCTWCTQKLHTRSYNVTVTPMALLPSLPNPLHCYSLFVEVDSVVVHTTSISTTSRMLPVFTCKGDQQTLSLLLFIFKTDKRFGVWLMSLNTYVTRYPPMRPCPWLTWPRSFLVLVLLVGCGDTLEKKLTYLWTWLVPPDLC